MDSKAISRQLTDGHKQTENPVYGHDTTSTSSILLETLDATILVFLVTNASIKKSKCIFSVYIYNKYIQVYT